MINSYLVDPLWSVVYPDPPRTKYNIPIAPTITPIKGLIEWKSMLVRSIEGGEVTAKGRVLLRRDTNLPHSAKLRIYDPARKKNIDHAIITTLPAKGYSIAGIWIYL